MIDRNGNDRVSKWAYDLRENGDFVVVDCETTSLDGEICDLAIVGADGTVLFDRLIKPVGAISEAARGVHHISDQMLEGAPSFAEIWPEVWPILKEKKVITYNSKFDFGMVVLSLLAHNILIDEFTRTEDNWQCLMKRYCQHIQKTRWQKLDTALAQQGLPVTNNHRALGDAQAAHALFLHLAGKYTPPTPEQEQQERERKERQQRDRQEAFSKLMNEEAKG